MIAFAEDYLWEFPSVQMSESMYTTHLFVKQKYFAPVEMLYKILEMEYDIS